MMLSLEYTYEMLEFNLTLVSKGMKSAMDILCGMEGMPKEKNVLRSGHRL